MPIHVLYNGRTLCPGMEGVPAQWPGGNTWIRLSELPPLMAMEKLPVQFQGLCRECFLRGRMQIEAEKGEAAPMSERRYWVMSFADSSKPEGSQFLGCTVVRAASFIHAHWIVNRLGINPGGELQGTQMDADRDPPGNWLNRLIKTREECDELGKAWVKEMGPLTS